MIPLPLPPLAMGDWVVPAMAVFLIFGGGGVIKSIVDSLTRTRIELAQLKSQQQSNTASGSEINAVRQELTALRQEIHSLRDTSTQYDMSFDTALQRMERRVEHVEQQQQQKIGY